MKIRIEKIIYPGKSFSRHDGKVIFTDSGLPQELVEIKVIKEKKNYIDAETINILEENEHRIKPRCDHYTICSPYQYIDYPWQLEIKKAQIQGFFSHNLKINLENLIINSSPDIWGYRNKIHLHIFWENNTAYAAYHLPKTHNKFVKITECHLVSEQTNKFLKSLLDLISKSNLKFIKEIVIRESSTNNNLLLVLYVSKLTDTEKLTDNIETLGRQFPLAGCTCILNKNSQTKLIGITGENSIEEEIAGRVFSIGPSSFFQINTPILNQLLSDTKSHLALTGKEKIADLYCGLGTFGLALSDYAGQIYGIEAGAENIHFLKRNLKKNNISNFTVCHGMVEEEMARILKNDIDIALIDPPRKGIGDFVCKQLLNTLPKTIVYISCNPATLIRDLKLLLTKYTLSNVSIYDFFPHTPHIETCCILQK